MAVPDIYDMFTWYAYGMPESVAYLIGGHVKTQILVHKWDTCCVRVCRSLNYCGQSIPASSKYHRGADKKWYIFGTWEMRTFLTNRFGAPKVFPPKATDKDLANFKGILEFSAFHVDLWNGKELAKGSMSFFHRRKHIYLWPA